MIKIKIIAILTAVAALFIWLFFRKDDEFTEMDESNSTISDIEADNKAEALYTLLNKFGSLKIEDIRLLMSGMTWGNYAKVYNRFGKRKFTPAFNMSVWWLPESNYNLASWLNHNIGANALNEFYENETTILNIY